MASRRILKKNVNYISGELFQECVIRELLIPATEKAKVDELMKEILMLQDEAISRINHTYKTGAKEYYKKFYEDFNKKVNEIIDGIEALKVEK